MKKCHHCNKVIAFGGYKDENGLFCSRNCAGFFKAQTTGFCEKCLSETTDEFPGTISSVNAIGTMLMGSRWNPKGIDPCPNCGSVIQKKWITFGVGIIALGTYRILYFKKGITESDFIGRRLKNDPVNR